MELKSCEDIFNYLQNNNLLDFRDNSSQEIYLYTLPLFYQEFSIDEDGFVPVRTQAFKYDYVCIDKELNNRFYYIKTNHNIINFKDNKDGFAEFINPKYRVFTSKEELEDEKTKFIEENVDLIIKRRKRLMMEFKRDIKNHQIEIGINEESIQILKREIEQLEKIKKHE